MHRLVAGASSHNGTNSIPSTVASICAARMERTRGLPCALATSTNQRTLCRGPYQLFVLDSGLRYSVRHLRRHQRNSESRLQCRRVTQLTVGTFIAGYQVCYRIKLWVIVIGDIAVLVQRHAIRVHYCGRSRVDTSQIAALTHGSALPELGPMSVGK